MPIDLGSLVHQFSLQYIYVFLFWRLCRAALLHLFVTSLAEVFLFWWFCQACFDLVPPWRGFLAFSRWMVSHMWFFFRLIDTEMDPGHFEEEIKSTFGDKSFVLFSLGHLVSSISTYPTPSTSPPPPAPLCQMEHETSFGGEVLHPFPFPPRGEFGLEVNDDKQC